MSDQFVVVVYDISSDRRRTKLHKTLEQYGTPVQYSVFECLLSDKRLAAMCRDVAKVIKPKVDRVRYYYLCQACLKKVRVTSGPEVVSEVEAIIV